MKITVHPWTSSDLDDVRQVLWETWQDAYLRIIPRDDLETYFAEHYSVQKLQEMLRHPDVSGYLALADGAPSATEKLFHDQTKARLYVHQLYVRPSAQGLGIGRRLMSVAAKRARELGYDRVWLGVMVENTPAVSWYRAMGFNIIEQAPFTMGKTVVDHYIGYVPIAGICPPQNI